MCVQAYLIFSRPCLLLGSIWKDAIIGGWLTKWSIKGAFVRNVQALDICCLWGMFLVSYNTYEREYNNCEPWNIHLEFGFIVVMVYVRHVGLLMHMLCFCSVGHRYEAHCFSSYPLCSWIVFLRWILCIVFFVNTYTSVWSSACSST